MKGCGLGTLNGTNKRVSHLFGRDFVAPVGGAREESKSGKQLYSASLNRGVVSGSKSGKAWKGSFFWYRDALGYFSYSWCLFHTTIMLPFSRRLTSTDLFGSRFHTTGLRRSTWPRRLVLRLVPSTPSCSRRRCGAAGVDGAVGPTRCPEEVAHHEEYLDCLS